MPIFDDEQEDVGDELGYDLSKSEYTHDIRKAAIEYIDHFFCDKNYWAGGAISKSKLFREEHIKAVMELTIMDALALSYYCLAKNPPDTVNTSEKNWDIELCYQCLIMCAVRWIPKCHAGGILLVYLSMCHGVEFLPTMKKMGEIRMMVSQREKEAAIRYLAKEQNNDSESLS